MEIYQIYLTGSLLLLLLDGDSVPGGAAGPELPAREGRGAQGHQVGQRLAHAERRRQDHRSANYKTDKGLPDMKSAKF